MKKEKVNIENYQENAMRTCLPSARNWDYATHNYKAELQQKHKGIDNFYKKENNE